MRRALLLTSLLVMLLLSSTTPAQSSGKVVLVSDNVADLAVASAISKQLGYDLYITSWGAYERDTTDAILDSKPSEVLIIGREKAVPAKYERRIKRKVDTFEVLGGRTRQQTSINAYTHFKNLHLPIVVSHGSQPFITDRAFPIYVYDNLTHLQDYLVFLGPNINLVNYANIRQLNSIEASARTDTELAAITEMNALFETIKQQAKDQGFVSSVTVAEAVTSSGGSIRDDLGDGQLSYDDGATTVENSAPTALPVASASSGFPPLAVQFTGAGSDSDGSISSYAWNFGDGTTSNDQDTLHTFSTAGNYTVTLTVTDTGGAASSATLVIEVTPIIVPENNLPTASSSSNVINGSIPFTVQFTGSGVDSDGTITNYLWNFGDSTSSTAQNPTHEYAVHGNFTVTFTVTDNNGSIASATPIVIEAINTTVPPVYYKLWMRAVGVYCTPTGNSHYLRVNSQYYKYFHACEFAGSTYDWYSVDLNASWFSSGTNWIYITDYNSVWNNRDLVVQVDRENLVGDTIVGGGTKSGDAAMYLELPNGTKLGRTQYDDLYTTAWINYADDYINWPFTLP